MSDSPPIKKSSFPWLILAISVIAAAAPFLLVTGGSDIINWRSDVDAAFAEAKVAGKPVLIDFTADWCPPCKMMKRQVFSRERIKAAIEAGFIPLRIDVTERSANSAAVSARFGVKYLPTYLIVTADGEELRRDVGFIDEEKFLAWLSGGPSR